jgi:hypothetical protein
MENVLLVPNNDQWQMCFSSQNPMKYVFYVPNNVSGVDFWTSCGNESSIDFLVSPSENQQVKKYLQSNGIPFKVRNYKNWRENSLINFFNV